jgi:hypothetical protein
VSGGRQNQATGKNATVSGGRLNVASGYCSHVSGGGGPNEAEGNKASGDYAAILGGKGCLATGYQSSVSGGFSNWAEGPNASVTGGACNWARGAWSSLSGGNGNRAEGDGAAVTGGMWNVASGLCATVCGGGGPNPDDGHVADGDYEIAPGLGTPAYDSGWVPLSQAAGTDFVHSLGGDPASYVVEVISRTTNSPWPYPVVFSPVSDYYLDATKVTIPQWAGLADGRVRIWVCGP